MFLAGAGAVLIQVPGLAPPQAGAVLSSCSLAYIAGTLLCRRWTPRPGLAGTLRPFAAARATAAGLTALVAPTLVQRHGERVIAA